MLTYFVVVLLADCVGVLLYVLGIFAFACRIAVCFWYLLMVLVGILGVLYFVGKLCWCMLWEEPVAVMWEDHVRFVDCEFEEVEFVVLVAYVEGVVARFV